MRSQRESARHQERVRNISLADLTTSEKVVRIQGTSPFRSSVMAIALA
jgi:hypothetical protein